MSSSSKLGHSFRMNMKSIEIFDSLGLSFSVGAIRLKSALKMHHSGIPIQLDNNS